MNEAQAIGLCQCGCGQRTKVARVTDSRWGHVAGQPVRWVNGHQGKGPLPADAWREEDRGYKTPCWIWQRAMKVDGYGALKVAGRMHNAHRGVYLLRRGPLPDDLVLDHLCRVRSCVNPDHMEPVPCAVNCQRGAKARLTPEIVTTLRQRVANGERQTDLAAEYGLSSGGISEIINRRRWAALVRGAPAMSFIDIIKSNTTTEARPTVEELIKATAAALAKPPAR
jgi:hypothetical protein